jgi:HEPN domain-containing protein
MMRERRPPDDPGEWLNRAKSNLVRARADARLDDVYLEDLCFDTQQAAEKAIKAVLIHNEVDFPYVHDIARLLSLVEEAGISLPSEVREAEVLTPYAVLSRYPGVAEPITKERYKASVAIAEAVLEWAQEKVSADVN